MSPFCNGDASVFTKAKDLYNSQTTFLNLEYVTGNKESGPQIEFQTRQNNLASAF